MQPSRVYFPVSGTRPEAPLPFRFYQSQGIVGLGNWNWKRKEIALGGANLSAGRIGSLHPGAFITSTAGGREENPSHIQPTVRAVRSGYRPFLPVGRNGSVNSYRTENGAMSATLRYEPGTGIRSAGGFSAGEWELFGWSSSKRWENGLWRQLISKLHGSKGSCPSRPIRSDHGVALVSKEAKWTKWTKW